MAKIVKLTVFLAIVAGISGGIMSFVYSQTNPIIQEAAIETVKESLEEIYPGEEFSEESTGLDEYEGIEAVYKAGDAGYVYECSVYGYSSSTPITFLIGLDNDGTYKGYVVTDLSGETKGLGSQVGDDAFVSSIVGSDIGSDIDTISGATISSSAVLETIDNCVAHYEDNYQ